MWSRFVIPGPHKRQSPGSAERPRLPFQSLASVRWSQIDAAVVRSQNRALRRRPVGDVLFKGNELIP